MNAWRQGAPSNVEYVAERKLLWRSLIDNACSESADLTDNELVALLMSLQGFSQEEIARVLEKEKGGPAPMSRSNVFYLKERAFRKVLRASGLDEEATMPRGVYDRSKAKRKAGANNHGAIAEHRDDVVVGPPRRPEMASNGAAWGPARVVSPDELPTARRLGGKWVPLYRDALLRLEQTPRPDYIAYDFPSLKECNKAADRVRKWRKRDALDIEIAVYANGNGGATLYFRRGPEYHKKTDI